MKEFATIRQKRKRPLQDTRPCPECKERTHQDNAYNNKIPSKLSQAEAEAEAEAESGGERRPDAISFILALLSLLPSPAAFNHRLH